MRKIKELIYKEQNDWNEIIKWIKEAKNQVSILHNSRADGENTLLKLQVTNKSIMGAIALECGGIHIDNGWLRILGSGSEAISGSLLSWNNLNERGIEFPLEMAMVIAYDIIGGFYAINGGEFEGELSNVFYFAPDTLEWEDMGMGYADFVYWCLNGDLDLYYKTFRWKGWENDIKKLSGEQGVSVFPYLWTRAAKSIENCSKRAVTMRELWGRENWFARQINGINII